jgi:hypothetical protein
MSDWIAVLRDACEQRGQKRVAAEVGYSPAVISRVLKGNYTGRADLVKERVESVLIGDRTVTCPVLGEIAWHECLDTQRLPFAATNAQRVRLYRACRSGCPNSRLEEE